MQRYAWSLNISDSIRLCDDLKTVLEKVPIRYSQETKSTFFLKEIKQELTVYTTLIFEYDPAGTAVAEISPFLDKKAAYLRGMEPGSIGIIVTCSGFNQDSEDRKVLEYLLRKLEVKYS